MLFIQQINESLLQLETNLSGANGWKPKAIKYFIARVSVYVPTPGIEANVERSPMAPQCSLFNSPSVSVNIAGVSVERGQAR